jgi:hypothetical protein
MHVTIVYCTHDGIRVTHDFVGEPDEVRRKTFNMVHQVRVDPYLKLLDVVTVEGEPFDVEAWP